MSWQISANPGEIPDKILLPGDPLRAKHIAEEFFENPKLFNNIRNMLGYSGIYKGVPVAVMGTGMGLPSMAIYATDLVRTYRVKKLIRVGTCGALHYDIHVRDIVIAQGATTDSSMPHNIFGPSINFAPLPDFKLLLNAYKANQALNYPVFVGNVLSQDRLYDNEINFKKLISYGVLAAEMESAALYLVAAQFKAQALGIFTVSNHIITGEDTTVEERETSFDDMAKLALETIILD